SGAARRHEGGDASHVRLDLATSAGRHAGAVAGLRVCRVRRDRPALRLRLPLGRAHPAVQRRGRRGMTETRLPPAMSPSPAPTPAATPAADRRRILVVDNYDSFVYNLVQYLHQLGAECEVLRNDAVTTRDVEAGGY